MQRLLFPAGPRTIRSLEVVPSPETADAWRSVRLHLIWDDEAWTFEHVRLAYDVEGAIARIEQAGLPRILGQRLRYGE